MMKKGGGLHKLTFVLLVIGGLNWLLYALSSWDIGMIFGDMNNVVARIIYILVGLSALYEVFTHKSNCKHCEGGMKKADSAPAGPAGNDQPGGQM